MSEIVFESTCKDIIMSDLPLTKKQYDESLERTARRNKMSETLREFGEMALRAMNIESRDQRYRKMFGAYNELIEAGYDKTDVFLGLLAEYDREELEQSSC